MALNANKNGKKKKKNSETNSNLLWFLILAVLAYREIRRRRLYWLQMSHSIIHQKHHRQPPRDMHVQVTMHYPST